MRVDKQVTGGAGQVSRPGESVGRHGVSLHFSSDESTRSHLSLLTRMPKACQYIEDRRPMAGSRIPSCPRNLPQVSNLVQPAPPPRKGWPFFHQQHPAERSFLPPQPPPFPWELPSFGTPLCSNLQVSCRSLPVRGFRFRFHHSLFAP